MSAINHALPQPVSGWVLGSLLGSEKDRIPAQIVAVSTYPGEAMALTALLGGDGPEVGSLFVYLPFDAFTTGCMSQVIPYRELVWEDCPEGSVDVSPLDTLPERVACMRRIDGGDPVWERGRYLLTFDWPEANRMLHLVLLDIGQFALCPNHKMKWGDSPPLCMPRLQKLRGTWKVPS